MLKNYKLIKKVFIIIFAAVSYLFLFITPVIPIEIEDDPVELSLTSAPPNIMFVLDDSGSMRFEFMTKESGGRLIRGSGESKRKYRYLYSTNVASVDYNGARYWKGQWYGYNHLFYNPFVEYKPWPGGYGNADMRYPRVNPIKDNLTFDLNRPFTEFHTSAADDHGNTYTEATHIDCNISNYIASLEDVGDHDVFKIVLLTSGNLVVRTRGCTDTEGRLLDASGEGYTPYNEDCSDLNGGCPDDNPNCVADCDLSCEVMLARLQIDKNFYIAVDNIPAGTYYIDVKGFIDPSSHHDHETGTYLLEVSFDGSCETPTNSPPEPDLIIRNAHYFVVDDNNGSIYLVNFNFNPVRRDVYKFEDENDDEKVSYNELTLLANPPAFLTTRTAEEDLQNFANWFSYYRKRDFTAKAAVSLAIDMLEGVNVGLYSLKGYKNEPWYINQPVLDVNTNRSTLFTKLFSLDPLNETPLRTALKDVGHYFDKTDGNNNGNIGPAPWADEDNGGACQQAFAIVMTDGFWNDESEYSPNVGNVDGNDPPPFKDDYANTLADVARYFYKKDLNEDLPDLVPGNDCDQNSKQHMVTYTIGFGVKGKLNPDNYDSCMLDVINGDTTAPTWPDPFQDDPAKIDDLWHAAINGRGGYFSAGNPEQLINALKSITENIKARTSSGAAVAINGSELAAGNILYQTSYYSKDWTGNIKALSLDSETGMLGTPLWEGQLKLLEQDWDTGRRIITSDGNNAAPFRFDFLTSAQRDLLGDNAAIQHDIINFIRGKEVAGFRIRAKRNGKVMKLGDLVHSAPALANDTVFVGANDGMLHAFNAQTGEERFAFIPNSVYPHLAELADVNYSHRFYVDLSPTINLHATINNNSDQQVLVGGLGAGGKGYFALNITEAASINSQSSEDSIKSMFLWEYPGETSDPDLGISLSQVSIVKTNSNKYVAIFGNGYNSDNGHAVLYILDLSTGDYIKKLDTQVGDDNGLSTPAVVDVNGDFKADYIYAGDLKGNLWKFDISSSQESEWNFAFFDGSTPKPLFQAVGQPITARPDVMHHCSKHGYIVVFGTGKYLGISDISDTSTQSVYGIWDYGDKDISSEYVGSFDPSTNDFTPSSELNGNNVELLEQTIINTQVAASGVQYRTFSDNQANWSTEAESDGIHLPDPKGTASNPAHVGWYVKLGGTGFEGERVVKDITIRNGKAIIITIIPEDELCSGGGRSVLYEADACDGSRLGNPVFDVNEDETLDANDTLSIPNVGDTIPTGRVFDVLINNPAFLQIPTSITGPNRQEFKYLSTSRGTIERIREPGDFTGIYYWVEW